MDVSLNWIHMSKVQVINWVKAIYTKQKSSQGQCHSKMKILYTKEKADKTEMSVQ